MNMPSTTQYLPQLKQWTDGEGCSFQACIRGGFQSGHCLPVLFCLLGFVDSCQQNRVQPAKGCKPIMRGHKLRSGVNWYGGIKAKRCKTKGMKQGLHVHFSL